MKDEVVSTSETEDPENEEKCHDMYSRVFNGH